MHPNLKAIVPTYSVWDLYDDVSAPGGIFYHDFLSDYAGFCETLDRNIIPAHRVQPGAKLATYGVQRVRGTGPRKTARIIAQHTCNVYHPNEGGTATFMDDTLTLNGSLYVRDVLSPHLFANRIKRSGAAIYSWSGWRDAGFVHSAIRQYTNLDNGRNMLRIGPWNHGGSSNISPTQWNRSRFDDIKEVVRFFDYHLMGLANGLDSAPRVNYYTLVEDKWKAAETWPPPAQPTKVYLGSGGTAAFNPIKSTTASTTYVLDTSRSVQLIGRWDMETNNGGPAYASTALDDSLTLAFTTAPLLGDMEITGHTIAHIYLRSSVTDGSIFAYLEDVQPDGLATQICDGQLQFMHRKTQAQPPHYKDHVPYHSYTSTDAAPMDTTAIEQLTFDLMPTSFLVKAGHKLRIRLAGTDVDHFKMLYPNGGKWSVFHDAEHASYLELPVVANPVITGSR